MIIPSSRYPSQVDVTDLTNYPRGKARNVVATGDLTGTPFERDWINDIWGWMQSLAANAGITPSGSPDTAVSSQLFTAAAAANIVAAYTLSGTGLAAGATLGLTEVKNVGGYVLASNQVQVPSAGTYMAWVTAYFTTTITGTVDSGSVRVKRGAAAQAAAGIGWVRPAGFGDVSVSFCGLFDVAVPASELLSLIATNSGGTFSMITATSVMNQLIIQRVK